RSRERRLQSETSDLLAEVGQAVAASAPDVGADGLPPLTGPHYFDPLDLPPETAETRDALRDYRMTAAQLDALRHIISIYRGTHNWHNYIPGAAHGDPRCFIRVMDMQTSDPDVRPDGEPGAGMEWIRIKIRARALARFQFRRMVALAVLVVRSNTPRSVVAGSFGVAHFDIPECPARGMIFDLPLYDEYNNEPARPLPEYITFDDEKSVVERFRRSHIHECIYQEEYDEM
ncbi:tRNA pseudouridine synthase 1, partial [Cladochytrium tenue]